MRRASASTWIPWPWDWPLRVERWKPLRRITWRTHGLAQAFYSRKEFESFRNAVERAVALNSMDGYSIAFLGELLTYTGDWKRGLELAGRARRTQSPPPGMVLVRRLLPCAPASAISTAQSPVCSEPACRVTGASTPGLAACHTQLGDRDAAGKALHELLSLRPNFAATVRAEFAKWWIPEYVELFIDGLQKAGLEVPPGNTAAAPVGG